MASTGGAPGTGGSVTGTGGAPNGSTGGRTTAGTGGRIGAGTAGAGTGGAGTGGAVSGGRSGAAGRGMGGATTATGGAPATGTGGAATATGGAAGAAAGEIIFTGDFETGNLNQWVYVERCATDRITVYNAANMPAGAPAPRQGQYAARFHVLDTDVDPCTSTENPRAELETPESLFKPGDDRWEAWSLYIPTTVPTPLCGSCDDGAWFVFQEDYGAPWDGSPAVGWNFDFTANPKKIRMDRGEQYGHDQPGGVDIATGRWMDLLVHKKFANTASGGGFVEAWVDGAPIAFPGGVTKLMTQTMHSTQNQLGFYLTAYRMRGYFTSFDVYYDAIRIGTTSAAVELPR
jgi:hypothetical protein